MSSSNQSFKINLKMDNKNQEITVTHQETTDSVSYYSCGIAGEELCQIREEIYGKWEQLWGNLDQGHVQEIGKKINAHLSTQ